MADFFNEIGHLCFYASVIFFAFLNSAAISSSYMFESALAFCGDTGSTS